MACRKCAKRRQWLLEQARRLKDKKRGRVNADVTSQEGPDNNSGKAKP
jgi:hypothetical protein